MALHPKRKPRDGMDEYGRSPLHYAAGDDGNLVEVKKLVLQGLDINMQDDGGWSPIFFAVQSQNIESITYLLQNGANPNVADKYNHTPLSRALGQTRLEPDIDAEVMEILIKHGAKNEPMIANEAKWIVDGEVIPGGTMSPRKMAVIELLAKDFTVAKPPWA